MSASICAPAGLTRGRCASSRLSRLARAWEWMGPVVRGRRAEFRRSGSSTWVAAASELAPGDRGRPAAPGLGGRTADGAAPSALGVGSDPAAECAGSKSNTACDLAAGWVGRCGPSTSSADPSLSPVPSGSGLGKIDRSGCVTPTIDPNTAQPMIRGSPMRADTRREPKAGRRAKLLSWSLTLRAVALKPALG
jgi:hypothetical protein